MFDLTVFFNGESGTGENKMIGGIVNVTVYFASKLYFEMVFQVYILIAIYANILK